MVVDMICYSRYSLYSLIRPYFIFRRADWMSDLLGAVDNYREGIEKGNLLEETDHTVVGCSVMISYCRTGMSSNSSIFVSSSMFFVFIFVSHTIQIYR